MMPTSKLHIVTASIDLSKTLDFWPSWRKNGTTDFLGHVLTQGKAYLEPNPEVDNNIYSLVEHSGSLLHLTEVLGTVPAFAAAVRDFDCDPNDLICLFHDDLRIDEKGWDQKVLNFFEGNKLCVHAGFGGGLHVGRAGMYDQPFDPYTLARHTFKSNLVHAEAHGLRTITPERIAVLDGFSLIGRAWFVKECLELLMKLEIKHHIYDVAFGCMAKRKGLETWLLPLACHHHGGINATSSAYLDWANKHHGGDGEIWRSAHEKVWNEFRDVLPF